MFSQSNSPLQRTAPNSRIVLCTLNCRHPHTSTAIRILRNIALDHGLPAIIEEFGLNEPIWKMADALLRHNPVLVGLSVYIWNREKSLELARLLKTVHPDLVIVAGGPELSNDAEKPETIDVLIRGEGEAAWSALLRERFAVTPPAPLVPSAPSGADHHTWPYRDLDLSSLHRRLAYIETTRGCPFRCAFCMGWKQGPPGSSVSLMNRRSRGSHRSSTPGRPASSFSTAPSTSTARGPSVGFARSPV